MPLAGLVAMPCLANLWFILGITQGDPAYVYSYLAVGRSASIHAGFWASAPTWFDPAFGQITEAQGHLAAMDWLHGVIPWWNPYTGIGMPLAAEMQTLAFFQPFVMLLALHHGWLLLRLSLQALSGITLYALLIELGGTRAAAFTAGALFGLSGAFFMLPQATGPLPFMPLLLLGVEHAARAARERAPLGWGWIAIGLALMLYSGFPETAYFGGLLAGVWTLMRFAGLGALRWRFLGKVALGGVFGLITTLPLLVPFLHYLEHAFIGPHKAGYSMMIMPQQGIALSVLPFLFGPIGIPNPPNLPAAWVSQLGPAWDDLGSWFGPVALLGGLAMLVRLRGKPVHDAGGRANQGDYRSVGIALGLFILVGALRMVGAPGIMTLVNLIPGMARANAVRFLAPTMDLALLILVGLAIDQWHRRGPLSRGQNGLIGSVFLTLLLAVLLSSVGLLRAWYRANPGLIGFAVLACGIDLAACVVLMIVLARKPTRFAAGLLTVVLVGDALFGFGSAQVAAHRHQRLELGGVRWLQRHQGLSRMFTILPFGPNYPAAYRVASINSSQLPVDAGWMRQLMHRLGPPLPLVGIRQEGKQLRHHIKAYEAVGVRYVVALSGTNPLRPSPPLSIVAQPTRAITLAGGTIMRGRVPAGLIPHQPIRAVSVLIGTYDGASTGPLMITLCAGADCVHGTANLGQARDDQFLRIRLGHPLHATLATPLRFTLRHPIGSPVAIWSGSRASMTLPALRLLTVSGLPDAHAVFHDKVMTIYPLPHPAPIFQAAGCHLQPTGWNRLTARCARPSTLIRRVAWFAGWHARVNGRATAVRRDGRLFQAIPLPAGLSQIRFSYRPRDTRWSIALALLAVLGMSILYGSKHRRYAKPQRPSARY
jgi:hypothetical protein